MPPYLRDRDPGVELCVEACLKILTELRTEEEEEDQDLFKQHLWNVLEILWNYPAAISTKVDVEFHHHIEFYNALVKDGVDVSMLEPPDG